MSRATCTTMGVHPIRHKASLLRSLLSYDLLICIRKLVLHPPTLQHNSQGCYFCPGHETILIYFCLFLPLFLGRRRTWGPKFLASVLFSLVNRINDKHFHSTKLQLSVLLLAHGLSKVPNCHMCPKGLKHFSFFKKRNLAQWVTSFRFSAAVTLLKSLLFPVLFLSLSRLLPSLSCHQREKQTIEREGDAKRS